MGTVSGILRAWRNALRRPPRRATVSQTVSAPVETAAPRTTTPESAVRVEPSAGRSDAAAWLRIIDEDGGPGVRAALFLTSGGGEPVGFCFGRVDRNDSAFGQPGSVERAGVASLVGSLLRSAFPRPVLALGLEEELPADAFIDEVAAGLPWGRVELAGAKADSVQGEPSIGSGRVSWTTQEGGDEWGAGRLFDGLMRRDHPFEPLERAAGALAVAFADRRVEDLTRAGGLTTVVALSSRSESPRDGAGRSAADEAGGLTLAERLWDALAVPADPPRLDQAVQLGWPGTLMPFQQDGVRALLASDRLLLADDMGLGKTVQAIAAVRILFAKKKITSCLVAAPASLLDQWRREIDKWAPELSAIIIRGSAADRAWQWAAQVDVTLVSYDTLRSDASRKARAPVRMNRWDVVVADEAQRIKNRNDTSDAVKGLWRTRSWALTGTPIENHEEELASILEFVDHQDSSAPRRYRPGVELSARHRELQLRRRKGDVLDDLPPKRIARVPIALSRSQRASYDRAERDGIIYLKSLGAEVSVRHVLELVARLKQICNADPQTGESSKLEDVKDRLEQLTAQGHRALVFSQYTSDTSGVAAAVRCLREFNPLAFTGALTREERTAVVDRFRADQAHKVLVLSLRAGGLGLNLQEASYVFHLDRWWNPALERQAEDRSHRIGQTVKVNVIAYSCTGTIEERIDAILQRKQALFDEVVDDVSLDLSARMNRGELLGLFGLE